MWKCCSRSQTTDSQKSIFFLFSISSNPNPSGKNVSSTPRSLFPILKIGNFQLQIACTVKYNNNRDQGSIFPVVPDDYNLIRMIKKTSKVTVRTSEVLFNHKILSKILIFDFIHFPSVLITISST